MWVAAAVVFALDYVTKWIIEQNMSLFQSIPVIHNVFHITYVRNSGAAFGILRGQTAFFIVITVLVIAGIIWFSRQIDKEDRLLRLSLGLIMGGAVGNLLDRIRYGEVVDWLDFRVWPVFNLADSAIVVGGIVIAYLIIVRESRSESSDA